MCRAGLIRGAPVDRAPFAGEVQQEHGVTISCAAYGISRLLPPFPRFSGFPRFAAAMARRPQWRPQNWLRVPGAVRALVETVQHVDGAGALMGVWTEEQGNESRKAFAVPNRHQLSREVDLEAGSARVAEHHADTVRLYPLRRTRVQDAPDRPHIGLGSVAPPPALRCHESEGACPGADIIYVHVPGEAEVGDD